MPSRIEWTDETWNPVVGCSHVSAGCANCYAERRAVRLAGQAEPVLDDDGDSDAPATAFNAYASVVAGSKWSGKTALVESALDKPLHWRKPRRIFVCSMSDLFHESVPDAWIDRVLNKAYDCSQHTFMLLTKRAARMRAYRTRPLEGLLKRENVWWGVTVERQDYMDRVADLLQIPAAVRFVSLEPLLGPVDATVFLRGWHGEAGHHPGCDGNCCHPLCPVEVQVQDPQLDWVIVGPETGLGRRPCDPAWIQSVVEQCRAASVPCFVKAFPMPDGRISKNLAEWPAWARVREWPNA